MTSRVVVALRIAAPPSRVFTAFTAEIGQWWRPHGLFALNGRGDGRLAVEPGLGGRIIESYPDGEPFEVGHVRVWDPPHGLVFSWRAASFPPDRETEVHVRFEHVEGGTRVVVEHLGWTASRRSTPPATASRSFRSSNAWPSGGRRCSHRWPPRRPASDPLPSEGRSPGPLPSSGETSHHRRTGEQVVERARLE